MGTTLTAGTIFALVFGVLNVVRANRKDLEERIEGERERLENATATSQSRVDAAVALEDLKVNEEQRRSIATFLQSFLQNETQLAPDTAGLPPCQRVRARQPAPKYVSSALHALGAVAHHGRPIAIALTDVDLTRVEADSVVLSGASLARSCLQGARLERARLSGSDLRNAQLDGAQLTDADLDDVRLEDASLAGANLNKATLRRARLARADLRRASLFATDLTLALLGEVRLDGADLSGATFLGTYLAGASLADVRAWDEVRSFEGAYLGDVQSAPAGLPAYALAHGAITPPLSQRQWDSARSELEAHLKR